MAVSYPNRSFILIFVLTVVQGALEPNGVVSLGCVNKRTFICTVKTIPIGWNITGLRGISVPGPFRARPVAPNNPRIVTNDTGGDKQVGVSVITISGFSKSDNGGIIQCVNMDDNSTEGMAIISVVPLLAPTNVVAIVRSCDVTLQWTQPSEPNDITTSVSCTPPSPGCAKCTTSPCNITGLNPSTEYVFTVTLKSGQCRNMSTSTARTIGLGAPTNVVATVESCDTVTLQWDQPSEPNDITTSVSCTPPSPVCAKCTTSPCTITGLNSSTVFTVTLNSRVCATYRNTTEAFQIDASSCIASNSTNISTDTTLDTSTDTSPGDTSLAALAVLVLPIPLIYPLGVLIVRVCCFKDKSYCEVFWFCGCCRKDKSPRCKSTELLKSPHPTEEVEYQNVNKRKQIRFVADGEKNQDQIGNKQEHVVTYETVEQLGDDDGDVITDETVEQQGNEDGITYATLDFSGHRKGNVNVVHSIADDVTYAAV